MRFITKLYIQKCCIKLYDHNERSCVNTYDEDHSIGDKYLCNASLNKIPFIFKIMLY